MALTHADLSKSVALWLLKQPWCHLICWELRYNKGRVDAIGIGYKKKTARIAVVEVKRTRADLLQDLNAGKLLKYQTNSTHCYLAATEEALGLDKRSWELVLEDLTTRGLPKSWGILLIKEDISVLRSARPINKINKAHLDNMIRKIARKHMWINLFQTENEDEDED